MLADDGGADDDQKRFNYPPLTGGPVTGSVVLDPGSVKDSIHWPDPRSRPR